MTKAELIQHLIDARDYGFTLTSEDFDLLIEILAEKERDKDECLLQTTNEGAI